MGRRNLGDVLHHFISEEEQLEARQAARLSRSMEHSRAPRWCIPATPLRPLSCAVAIDLAAVTAQAGHPTEILAPFAPHRLLPRCPEVSWRVIEPGPDASGSLAHSLAQLQPATWAFLLVPPQQLASALHELSAGDLDGMLLPIEARPQATALAFGLLRELARPIPELRIGAVLIGATSEARSRSLFRGLERAAHRQLGLEIEDLGELRRDSASFRALLHGVPTVEVDGAGASAQSLRDLSARLVPAPAR